jgi:hypothetical protein
MLFLSDFSRDEIKQLFLTDGTDLNTDCTEIEH